MNNFLNLHLKELSNHFDYPELELRVLLNRSSIIDKEMILSFSAKFIPLIPLEDLPLNNLSFFDINLIHFPSFVL